MHDCDKTTRRANHSKPVQPFAQKYSAFVLTQISRITPPVSRRMRGARDRHERAVRCDGREGATDVRAGAYGEVVWFGRRGAGVKRAIRSAGDGGKRAVLREEHEVSRKAIAQGRPECSRCPVCSCAILLCANRTRDRGCSKHPVFPAPSDFRGQTKMQTSGDNAPRDRETMSTSLRAQRSNPSIPLSTAWIASLRSQ